MRAVSLGVLFVIGAAYGQMGPEPYMDPFTAVSPSGHYRLWINPSEEHGAGKGTYSLSRDGKRLWIKEFAFTLKEAGISDDGLIGGYAYMGGQHSTDPIVVAKISPAGDATVLDRIHRQYPPMTDVPPGPSIDGFAFDSPNHRMTLCYQEQVLLNDSRQVWQNYSLVGKTDKATVYPKTGEANTYWPSGMRLITGTSLILTAWNRSEGEDSTGVVYTIHDHTGARIWKKIVPRDFTFTKAEDPEEKLFRALHYYGASLLPTTKPNYFRIWFVKAKQQVGFAVKQKDKKWSVTEADRTSYNRAGESGHASVPLKTLKKIGSLDIPAAKRKSKISWSGGFFFVDGQHVAVFDRERNAMSMLTLKGELVKNVKLPKAEEDSLDPHIAQTRPGIFLAFLKDGDTKCNCFEIDLPKGSIKKLSKYHSFPVREAAGFPDGRFVVITSEQEKNSAWSAMYLCAPDGQRVWTNGVRDIGGDGGGLMLDKVATRGKDEILLLDTIAKQIYVVATAHRAVLRTYNLESVVGHELNYPSDFTVGEHGQINLLDFQGKAPVKIISADGKSCKEISPHYADGKKIDLFLSPASDPAGATWVCDGRTISKVDVHGKVIATVGKPIASSGLSEVSDVWVDPLGRVTVLDRNSSEIHSFTASGKHLGVTRPLATDFSVRPITGGLTVTRSGDFYITGGLVDMEDGKGDLRFANGKRIGFVKVEEQGGGPALAQAKPSWRWIGDAYGTRHNRLVNEDGKVVVKLGRWPDMRWMSEGLLGVSPDGRLAIIGTPSQSDRESPITHLAIFGPGGKALSMARLSIPLKEVYRCAFDGDTVFCLRRTDLIAVDRTGKVLWRAKVGKDVSGMFPSRGGIAVWDGQSRVTWYATK